MGAADWDSTLQRPATRPAVSRRATSSSVLTGMKLTLGDTTIDIVATPGHTPGTLSYVFPVKDQGRTGDGRVFRRHADRRVRHQRRALGRIHRVAEANRQGGRRCGRDGDPSNHSEYDNAYTKARLIAAQARRSARTIRSSSAPTACSATSR